MNEGEQFFQRQGTILRGVVRIDDGDVLREEPDALAVEEPLEIRVDGETVAVVMRTPGQEAELGLGFLLAEGLIAGSGDVGSVASCGRPGAEGHGNVLDVRSAGGALIDVQRLLEGRRWGTTGSACGVCGRRSIDGLLARCGPLRTEAGLSARIISACVEQLARVQPIFAQTGGLHGAAIFDQDGALLASSEDIGRHNAVDKVIGTLLRRGRLVPQARSPILLAVSGRASFEIVQKAAMARLPFIASISAPSSLAVDLAERMRITLVGFARGVRFNVYSHAWRLDDSAPGVTRRFTPPRE
ncbi:MAG TPA: formate dehydrogenase accessory sulfurtransferase FdhD [Anaeromyxobacteraceae bacterium]|nr:formate dehydrogenase accessory sulfurtransferase FdhD [Anaeromyxobacteraceae bacterium]